MNGYDVVKDYRKIRQIIGYMPGISLYQDLSVEENLKFLQHFSILLLKKTIILLKISTRDRTFKNRRAGALSGGMKQSWH